MRRVVDAMYPVAIALPRRYAGQITVPDLVGILRERDAVSLGALVVV
jgi:hypothetical protein